MSNQEQAKDEGYQPQATFSSTLSPTTGLDDPVTFAFSRLCYNTWFEGRCWTDVFKLLIDSYRLRVATQRDLDGKSRRVPKKEKREVADGLRKFLRLAEAVPELLPQEWNWVLAARCKVLARHGDGITNWYSLDYLPNEDEIAERYQDSFFPGQLQIFAKLVYGTDVGDQDAEILWGIMRLGEDMAKGNDDDIPTI